MKEFAGFVVFCLVILDSAFEAAQAENSSSAEASLRVKNVTAG
ncbi:hypothetical protein [Bradyrhizobium sp. USDA 3458]|nr:hypothetical protein [Bradyrhizobium sp. USDA 3458]